MSYNRAMYVLKKGADQMTGRKQRQPSSRATVMTRAAQLQPEHEDKRNDHGFNSLENIDSGVPDPDSSSHDALDVAAAAIAQRRPVVSEQPPQQAKDANFDSQTSSSAGEPVVTTANVKPPQAVPQQQPLTIPLDLNALIPPSSGDSTEEKAKAVAEVQSPEEKVFIEQFMKMPYATQQQILRRTLTQLPRDAQISFHWVSGSHVAVALSQANHQKAYAILTAANGDIVTQHFEEKQTKTPEIGNRGDTGRIGLPWSSGNKLILVNATYPPNVNDQALIEAAVKAAHHAGHDDDIQLSGGIARTLQGSQGQEYSSVDVYSYSPSLTKWRIIGRAPEIVQSFKGILCKEIAVESALTNYIAHLQRKVAADCYDSAGVLSAQQVANFVCEYWQQRQLESELVSLCNASITEANQDNQKKNEEIRAHNAKATDDKKMPEISEISLVDYSSYKAFLGRNFGGFISHIDEMCNLPFVSISAEQEEQEVKDIANDITNYKDKFYKTYGNTRYAGNLIALFNKYCDMKLAEVKARMRSRVGNYDDVRAKLDSMDVNDKQLTLWVWKLRTMNDAQQRLHSDGIDGLTQFLTGNAERIPKLKLHNDAETNGYLIALLFFIGIVPGLAYSAYLGAVSLARRWGSQSHGAQFIDKVRELGVKLPEVKEVKAQADVSVSAPASSVRPVDDGLSKESTEHHRPPVTAFGRF